MPICCHDPQRLVGDADGAGFIAGAGIALDDHHPHALVREQVRRGQADGAGSDHQDVGVDDVAHQGTSWTVLRRVPRPVISTSTTSPSESSPEGTMNRPTPPGVPVTITSPGESRVKPVT